MKCLLAPDNSAYTAEYGEEVVRSALDGGAGRYRSDILNSSTMVGVQWITDREGYDYLMAFYRTITKRGALPFTIDLIINDSELFEHTVHIVPGSFKLTGQKGLSHTVAATLEVHSFVNVDEENDDNDIVDAYNAAHGYTP